MSDQPTSSEETPSVAPAQGEAPPQAESAVTEESAVAAAAPEKAKAKTEAKAKATVEATAEAPASKPAESKGAVYTWGTGRRKTAVARVRIRPGDGKFLINKREIDKHFFGLRDRSDIVAPMEATKTLGKYDVFVNVHGGGQTGQAGAVMLGLARALMKDDPELEGALRDGNYLTRDARKVERKKPGQPGARKRFQFSKR